MFKFAQLKSALPSHTCNKQNQSARGRSLNPAPIGSSALGYLAVLYVRGGGRNIWRHYRLKLTVHFIFDQLCTFHSFPLHSSVLKPYFYLSLGEVQGYSYLVPPESGQVVVDRELFLQLPYLVLGEGRPFFPRFDG